jgi:tripartite-type tricarboxylate transporter receptor subunit TctC
VPIAIAVTPSLPANSLSELVALSQKQRGKFNVGFQIRGGITHLTAELFRTRSGADLTPISYPSAAQAMTDTIGGTTQVFVDGLAGPINGSPLRLLAIAAPERVATHLDVPTVAETIPGFVATGWFVLMAPPRTPAAIAKKVSDDLLAAINDEDVRRRLAALTVSTRAMTPQQLGNFIRSEQQLWKPVIDQLGLATQ